MKPRVVKRSPRSTSSPPSTNSHATQDANRLERDFPFDKVPSATSIAKARDRIDSEVMERLFATTTSPVAA